MAVPPDSSLTRKQILENRRRFVERCGVDPNKVTAMRLGKAGNDELIRVLAANHHSLDPERAVQAEALIVEKPAAIFAVVADCPAVALETGRYLALVHAGWRGAAGLPIDARPGQYEAPGEGIVVKVVRKLSQLDGGPTPIRAEVSPGICGRHYTVHDDVARLFRQRYPWAVWEAGRADEQGPLFHLDIPAVLRTQLAEVAVAEVREAGRCTFEDPNLFSARGNTQGGQPWGRMGVLVVA